MKLNNIKINSELKLTCDFDSFDKEKHKFICRQLDIFDHCLTEDEALMKIMSYPVLKKNRENMSLYYEKEKLIFSFLKEIYKKYTIVFCSYLKHYSFESELEFKKYCINSIREKMLIQLHVSELNLTIYGNFDMNMSLNFLKKNPESVELIENTLKNYPGLYLL